MPGPVAFVLGGGGPLGAYEVGMLKAMVERGVRPDLVLGPSIGALNGAAIAADPRLEAVSRLEQLWVSLRERGVFADTLFAQMGTALRSRTHLFSNAALRGLLVREFGDTLIEDLEVPFECVAASIERAAEHWFTTGPLVEAVLASSAVPGLLPAVPVDGEHFLDGGLVDSVPVGRALASGAGTVYILHVGRIDQPLRPPRTPREVAVVVFGRGAGTALGAVDHDEVRRDTLGEHGLADRQELAAAPHSLKPTGLPFASSRILARNKTSSRGVWNTTTATSHRSEAASVAHRLTAVARNNTAGTLPTAIRIRI